ncbi:class I SAM-dependent methyltransferase [Chloroflexota bacterium]
MDSIDRLFGKFYPPSPVLNMCASKNFKKLGQYLDKLESPKILIVGCGKGGYGIHNLDIYNRGESVNLDIKPFPLIDVIGDAQKLPFRNTTFDAVIIQSVMQFIKEPELVVNEVFRVLKNKGYVYAEIPFLQGFHGGDYQRYTLLGINNLFQHFSIIDSGICAGPSSALNWILREYFAILFCFNSNRLYRALRFGVGWMTFWLKYLDILFAKCKNAHVIASGVFLMGKKD